MPRFKTVELFAGAGGLALGFERAGLDHILLNDSDKDACKTLKNNRPGWNIAHQDVSKVCFKGLEAVDVVSGGFPCQAFSYAGKKLGFEDTRGTLFFEFARAVKELQPKIFIAENVRGLLTHDNGETLKSIISVLDDIGYNVLPPTLLKAIFYRVPQKRERLFIIGLKKGCGLAYTFPKPDASTFTLKDALRRGELFNSDVAESKGYTYSEKKLEVLNLVPPGGYWRDLPLEIQQDYMGKSFYSGGGKTGMARRLSWDEPCLTLTCSPAQKQTERCHPVETRPLQVREYARIQTFPDDWSFHGSLASVYKQIGNAVPVNLGEALGRSIVECLSKHYGL